MATSTEYDEALAHFTTLRYKGMTMQKALLQAPKAMVQALHLSDLKAVHANPEVPVLEAVKYMRGVVA